MVNKIDMKALAKIGAAVALRAHEAKVAELKRFLHRPVARKTVKGRTMTPAQRKAVSSRMKKYWSEHPARAGK